MELGNILIDWVTKYKDSNLLVCSKREYELLTKVLIIDGSESSNYWEYTNRLGDKKEYHEDGLEKAIGYSTKLN
jgi:hypothetical protein